MIVDILLMADTAAQAKSHLEALTFLLTGLGFVINVQKSITPNPTDRVPGLEGGLSVPSSKSTRRETPPYKDGGKTTFAEAAGDSTTAGTIDWETACSFTGSSPGTSFLPVITRRPLQSSEPHQPELRCTGVSVSSSPRRAYLVAGEACPMEWQGSVVEATDDYHHVRCIFPGLGSSLQWYQNRGSKEPLGTGNAYKLPRITGSNPSSKDLSEEPDRIISIVIAGQLYSCSVYQQHGRYSVPPTDGSSQSPLDVGPVQ